MVMILLLQSCFSINLERNHIEIKKLIKDSKLICKQIIQ